MRKLSHALLVAGWMVWACPLGAQQVCPGLPYVANTPEDELMQAVNGAESPQEQIAALDKFAQAHADSKFMPCVNEYYTIAYLKLNNYDKVIEQGEKGLASNYQDMMLMLNVLKGYVASGKVGDSAFDIIMKAPEQAKSESNPPKPPNVSAAEWQKTLQELAEQAKDETAYVEYAFFQLLPRVTDGNKRAEILDRFTKAYPDSQNVAQINFNYFIAYKMANNAAKVDEYAEKAVAADPNNVGTLNLVADDYVTRQTNLDKAEDYAKRALDLAPNMKKPEGMSDDQFKSIRDSQLGLAHATLGYVAFLKGSKTRKLAPAIQEFKTAIDLLGSNPELQGRTLYYLGYAYEVIFPANHDGAIEALDRAANLQTSWKDQAADLLAKVKKAKKPAEE
jgi:tetratricopeptide (TPR) repeat protein